jgi:hypothetical protein
VEEPIRHIWGGRLQDRSSVPHSSPTQTPLEVIKQIKHLRRDKKWSTRRIALELRPVTAVVHLLPGYAYVFATFSFAELDGVHGQVTETTPRPATKPIQTWHRAASRWPSRVLPARRCVRPAALRTVGRVSALSPGGLVGCLS